MRVCILSLARYLWSSSACGLVNLILKAFLADIKIIHSIYCAQVSKALPLKVKESSIVGHYFIK